MLTKKAVLDRVVDGNAILLVGNEEEEMVVSAADLPEGIQEGDRLVITFDEQQIIALEYDEEATIEAKTRIQHKMALLRQRGRSE